jgi:hypothetical protein
MNETKKSSEARLPTVASWTSRTSIALAYRLAQLAAEKPTCYQLFKQTERRLHIQGYETRREL